MGSDLYREDQGCLGFWCHLDKKGSEVRVLKVSYLQRVSFIFFNTCLFNPSYVIGINGLVAQGQVSGTVLSTSNLNCSKASVFCFGGKVV